MQIFAIVVFRCDLLLLIGPVGLQLLLVSHQFDSKCAFVCGIYGKRLTAVRDQTYGLFYDIVC